MSQRYERVNAHDEDDAVSPLPNSPPPSFHSRASSRSSSREMRGRVVDATLADAFDTDADNESDEDADDDRQRLVRSRAALMPVRGPPPSASSATATTARSASSPTSTTTTTTTTTTSTRTPPAASRPQPPAGARSNRVYGGGIQSDGVFSNITAKPEPGEEKEELPPSYEHAAADAAPPYWETTILAPGLGGPDDVFVDGMPVGSVFSFVWNGMISMSFQVVGFLLTYLLHSTHAAKNGSRAGLGITLIQYGFYMKGSDSGGAGGMSGAGAAAAGSNGGDGYANPPDPNAHDFNPGSVSTGNGGGGGGGDGSGSGGGGGGLADIASSEWAAYALMIVGWFVLIRAVSDFLKARRHEQLVLQSPDRGLGVAVIAEGETPDHVV
ncbi:hypothetical protein SPI_05981 [Niveomyces insectorum RCEF 264]|uniref:Metal homeostatis protein bsd2 n=1 Tax=Niveomyces insectorum RCEF 264 TaxID=1081102 RepID=A0A167SNI8_9HYPO|nr:hypothetical protein SPI_05981 [Niveomyces insectorum RCEF 264]